MKLLVEHGLSEPRSCSALATNRTNIRYEPRPEDEMNVVVREALKVLAAAKAVYARLIASGADADEITGRGLVPGLRSPHDGIRPETQDADRDIDACTRECLEIRLEKKMKYQEVVETVDELMTKRGTSRYLHLNNGSEFIAGPLQNWLSSKSVTPIQIKPGNPWQNGFIESFNGKFRDKCLNQELFYSRGEAQVIVDKWCEQYNTVRPHSTLDCLAPIELAARLGGLDSNGKSAYRT